MISKITDTITSSCRIGNIQERTLDALVGGLFLFFVRNSFLAHSFNASNPYAIGLTVVALCYRSERIREYIRDAVTTVSQAAFIMSLFRLGASGYTSPSLVAVKTQAAPNAVQQENLGLEQHAGQRQTGPLAEQMVEEFTQQIKEEEDLGLEQHAGQRQTGPLAEQMVKEFTQQTKEEEDLYGEPPQLDKPSLLPPKKSETVREAYRQLLKEKRLKALQQAMKPMQLRSKL